MRLKFNIKWNGEDSEVKRKNKKSVVSQKKFFFWEKDPEQNVKNNFSANLRKKQTHQTRSKYFDLWKKKQQI